MKQVQATITGFKGQACTLFSVYDPDTRVLAISVETKYRAERRDNTIVISNDDVPRDEQFTDAKMIEAIRAFYSLKTGVASDGQSSLIVFGERAQRANPDMSVESDGVDSNGPKYRVADTITNAQVAALATCLWASKQAKVERALSMIDDSLNMTMQPIKTEVFTI